MLLRKEAVFEEAAVFQLKFRSLAYCNVLFFDRHGCGQCFWAEFTPNRKACGSWFAGKEDCGSSNISEKLGAAVFPTQKQYASCNTSQVWYRRHSTTKFGESHSIILSALCQVQHYRAKAASLQSSNQGFHSQLVVVHPQLSSVLNA